MWALYLLVLEAVVLFCFALAGRRDRPRREREEAARRYWEDYWSKNSKYPPLVMWDANGEVRRVIDVMDEERRKVDERLANEWYETLRGRFR